MQSIPIQMNNDKLHGYGLSEIQTSFKKPRYPRSTPLSNTALRTGYGFQLSATYNTPVNNIIESRVPLLAEFLSGQFLRRFPVVIGCWVSSEQPPSSIYIVDKYHPCPIVN